VPIWLTPLRRAAAIALAVLVVAGCSSSPSRLPTALGGEVPLLTLPTAPPVPDSPATAFLLLDWCWVHRDSQRYSEVFSADFLTALAVPDSAGNPYSAIPWTCADELASAARIFAASSSVSLNFDGDLSAVADPRPGKTFPWHQQVSVANLTLTIHWNDGSASRVSGATVFYVVRGDSAVLPQELNDRGFKPDRHRWYIEGWDDQTGCNGAVPPAAPSVWAVGRARTLPDECTSWGRIKLLFH
jgi:hypothetical protein